MAQNTWRGDARKRNVGLNRHCTLNDLAKHSHSLNNISDKLLNIVTGKMLQGKSILQIHFDGEWMKAHCISNFTYGFCKTI